MGVLSRRRRPRPEWFHFGDGVCVRGKSERGCESVFLLSSASPNTANYQVNAAVEERPGVLFASAGCQRQKSSHQHPRNTFEEGVESESERDGTLIL
jgi:hypothetical protein